MTIKLFICGVVGMCVVGCSSQTVQPYRMPVTQVVKSSAPVGSVPPGTDTTSISENGGTVQLVFDESGNWLAISTTAVAEIAGDSVEDQEMAVIAATMRGKRNIAEFLSDSVHTSKTTEAISKTVSKKHKQSGNSNEYDGDADDPDDTNHTKQNDVDSKNHKLARTVVERIASNSNQILRGVRVVSQYTEDDKVFVVLEASKTSIVAAKNIRDQMLGIMK